MVAHCIEDFFSVGVEAWPLAEGCRQEGRAISDRLKNLRFMSHKITPAYGGINGTIKHFFQRIMAMRSIHYGGLLLEGTDPLGTF